MIGARLRAWWKKRRADKHESESERLEEESGKAASPGPGGWSPLGDLSKLSDDK
jgi:hypothetical protein